MRLTKIVTKNGDGGKTSIANGTRLSKACNQINVIGDIDELNSFVGLLRVYFDYGSPLSNTTQTLEWIQNRLFDVGGEIASGTPIIQESEILEIEKNIESINLELTPLQNFILPTGVGSNNDFAVSYCHVCRSITRRAERSLVEFKNENPTYSTYDVSNILIFLNRLSDYFFVLARYHSNSEVLWTPIEKK